MAMAMMADRRNGRLAGLSLAAFAAAVLQHFGLGAATLVIPRLVAQAAGADAASAEGYCQLAMVALGIATLLQAWGWRGIGSGYLLPACFAGIYAAPALRVAAIDGLGGVAGLTIVAGITQVLLSRALRLVRGFIPSEVIGVAVVMIGLSWGMIGLRLICGVSIGQVAAPLEWISAVLALAVMVGLSVWGSQRLRPVAMLAGLLAGCLAAALLYLAYGAQALAMPSFVLAYPHLPAYSVDFTDAFLPGFMIGAVASLLRVAGDVVASHQVSDRNWKRPNTRTIAAGGLAEGLGNIVSGLLGVMPVNTSSGSVGLVAASGISAPVVAHGVGVLWIVMGLLPVGPPLLLLIPASVQGAAVFFTAAFVIRSGINMLTQRMIDNRRAITIGSALVVGLAFDEIMGALHLPALLKMVFSSSLLTAVAVAILLAALFRIGVRRRVETTWRPEEGPSSLTAWIEANNRLWAARTALDSRAEAVAEEFALAMAGRTTAPVKVVAAYDEVALRLDFTWQGPPLASPATDADEGQLLAAAMLRHHADHLSESRADGGRQRLSVTLDDL